MADDLEDPKIARSGGVLPKNEPQNDPKIDRAGGLLWSEPAAPPHRTRYETTVRGKQPSPAAPNARAIARLQRSTDSRGTEGARPTPANRGLSNAVPPVRARSLGELPRERITPARARPKQVGQIGKNTCWAASLESWLAANAKPLQSSQEDLLNGYQEGWHGFTNEDLREYLQRFTMSTFFLPYEAFESTRLKFLVDKYGPLYMGARWEDGYWWHSVILYQVDEPKLGARDKSPKYWVMDPGVADPKNGYYRQWSEEDFFRNGIDAKVLIGFKNLKRGGRALGELLDYSDPEVRGR